MKRSERGFTLIELLVVMAIVALIAGAAAMATFQVINVTKRSNDHMTVIRQVQNAGYWISHDTQMAQSIVTGDDPEFITLSWTNWKEDGEEDDEVHKIIYTFEDMPEGPDGLKRLKRQYLIYDDVGGVTGDETILVAEYIYIDGSASSFEPEQDGVWKLTIEAHAGTQTETREYEIKPRVNI